MKKLNCPKCNMELIPLSIDKFESFGETVIETEFCCSNCNMDIVIMEGESK